MMGGMMGLGWLLWLFLAVAIIWAVKYFVDESRSRPTNSLPAPDEDAVEILKKRYAKGEITREQYEQMKKDLI